MTKTDDRYEKILKAFESEFDVPKVNAKREASTEDWMDDGVSLKDLMRAKQEDSAGVIAQDFDKESQAVEDHDILSMNDLLKLQKEEEGGVSQKFNGKNESYSASEIYPQYSEDGYKQFLDSMLDDRGQLEVYGSYYNGADDLEQRDNVAFRTGYNDWIDGLQKDGIDTGADGYEAKATEGEFKCPHCSFSTDDDDAWTYHMDDHAEGNALVSDFMKYEMESKANESMEDEARTWFNSLHYSEKDNVLGGQSGADLYEMRFEDLVGDSRQVVLDAFGFDLLDKQVGQGGVYTNSDMMNIDRSIYGGDSKSSEVKCEVCGKELPSLRDKNEHEIDVHGKLDYFAGMGSLGSLDGESKASEVDPAVEKVWTAFQNDWSVGDEFEDWEEFAGFKLDDDEIKAKWNGEEGDESLDKIEVDDKDDTDKVYDKLFETFKDSTMENQNQGFKSDADEYGVADLNADRKGNTESSFWDKTITTDEEAAILQEYNPQPNAKMGDYNVEAEKELGAKDFPDSVTEVKKNDKFLASEVGTWEDIERDEGQSMSLLERNMWIQGHFTELSLEDFKRLAHSASTGVYEARESLASEGQFDPNIDDLWYTSDTTMRSKILSKSGITGGLSLATTEWDDLPLDIVIQLEEINVAALNESLAKEDDPDFDNDPDHLGFIQNRGNPEQVQHSQFTYGGFDQADNELNRQRGDLDYDTQSLDEDEEIIKKLLKDQGSVDLNDFLEESTHSDYKELDTESKASEVEYKSHFKTFDEDGGLYVCNDCGAYVYWYDDDLDQSRFENSLEQHFSKHESKATEDDFNYEFDELSSLAQQKIEDTDVTQKQWNDTPIPQREQLEDAIADAPVKKIEEEYDSMGDVWNCPECGFKTGFEEEINDHEQSHVKAFKEEDIARPYDNLLDQFR